MNEAENSLNSRITTRERREHFKKIPNNFSGDKYTIFNLQRNSEAAKNYLRPKATVFRNLIDNLLRLRKSYFTVAKLEFHENSKLGVIFPGIFFINEN